MKVGPVHHAFALALLLTASGCSSCERVPILELPDGGAGDGGGRDAGPRAVRHLVARPLFGRLPVENRIFDPTFALPTFAWAIYDQNNEEQKLIRGRRYDAPTQTPSLLAGEDRAGARLWLWGIGRGGPAPLFVQVFLATPGGRVSPEVSVLAFDQKDPSNPIVFTLPRAPDQTPFEDARGRTWIRHEGTITTDLPGWLVLTVEGPAPFEISGPVIVQGSAAGGLMRDLPAQVGPPRPATELERQHLQLLRERLARAQTPAALRRKALASRRDAQIQANAWIIEQARAGGGSERPETP